MSNVNKRFMHSYISKNKVFFNALDKIITLTILFFFAFTSFTNGQVVNLGCQDETQATLGLDRNDWNSGSTASHSEGSMHDFQIPANTFGDCKEITQVEVNITIIGVDISNLPPECTNISYYFNFYNSCGTFTPASCMLVGQIGPQGFPTNQNITFTAPPEIFNFGSSFGVDLVPASNAIGSCGTAQSLLTSGQVILDYDFCVEITVDDATPTSVVSLGLDESVCPGSTTTLDAGIFNSYLWGPNGETTPTITVGQGTYTVTVTDIANCTSTDEINVNQFPVSSITFDPANPGACDGGSVSVSVLESYNLYNWSNSASGQTVNLTPGPYMVTITDSNNCTAEESVTVDNIISPNAGIDNFLSVCNDGTLYNFDIALGTHDAGGTWSDDDFSGVDININSINVDFSGVIANPLPYEFTYTVPGTPPCPSDEAVITVQVVEAIFSGNSATESYCPNPGIIDFYLLLGNPTLGGTFSDDLNSGVDVSDGSSVNLDGLAPGNYEYTYDVSSNGTCPGSSTTLFITILNADSAGSNNSQSVCEGAPIDLTNLLSSDATLGGTFADDNISGALSGSIVNTTGLAGSTLDFTYTVGSGGGACGGDMSVITLVIESSLTAGSPVNESYCLGEVVDLSSILIGADTGGSFSDITGNGGLIGSSLNTTSLPSGISQYQYLIGDGLSCPKDSATISIEISPNPTVSFAGPDINLCNGECQTFTINISGNPTFNINTDLTTIGGTPIITEVLTTDNATYTLTACNLSNGESFANDTLNLNTDSTYVFKIPSIEDNNCIDDLTNSGDSIIIRTISFSDFTVDTMACITDTLMIEGLEFFNGQSTFIDTIPGQFCDSIININVVFSTADTIVFDQTICQDDSVLIRGTYYDIDNPFEEIPIINPNGCDSLIQVDLQFYPIADTIIDTELCTNDSIEINGIFYSMSNSPTSVTLPNQSANGCDSIINIALSFVNTPIVPYVDTLCLGQDIVIGGVTFNSFLDAVFGQISDTYCDTFSITVVKTYDINNPIGQDTLFGGSAFGCDSIVSINLSFYPPATFDLTGTICENDTIIINNKIYDFANRTGTEILKNESVNGCDSIVNIDLSFFPPVSFDLVDNLCEGDEIIVNGRVYDVNNQTGTEILKNQSVNGCDSIINIMLTFDLNVQEMVTQNPCIGDSIFVGGMYQFSDGVFTDTLATVDNCDSVVITTVTFVPCQFNVDPSVTNNVCIGDMLGVITIVTNSPDGSSYNIQIEDVNQNTQESGFLTGPNVNAVFDNLASGDYTINVVDINGVIVSTSTVSIISTNPPIDGTWVVIDSIQCEDGAGSISFSPSGGQSPYNFEWNDTSIGNMSTANDINAGIYDITVTDDLGCESFSTFELPDGVNQVFDIRIIDPSCDGATDGSIEIMGLNSEDGPYTISLNGETTSSTLIQDLPAGNYDIIVLDANLCELPALVTLVPESDIMFADYLETYSISFGDSVSIVGSVDTGVYTFVWMPSTALSCTDCALPIAMPEVTTDYTLLITDENGCGQTIDITVEVAPRIIIDAVPNIFSPNGDGANDDFVFSSGSENLTSIQMSIFDRWGNLLYQEVSTNGSVRWNGERDGKMSNNGVYIYHISILYNDNTSKSLFGDVTLIN